MACARVSAGTCPKSRRRRTVHAGVMVVTPADLASAQDAVALVLVALITTSIIIMSGPLASFRPECAPDFIQRIRSWIEAHTDRVVRILITAIGLSLVGGQHLLRLHLVDRWTGSDADRPAPSDDRPLQSMPATPGSWLRHDPAPAPICPPVNGPLSGPDPGDGAEGPACGTNFPVRRRPPDDPTQWPPQTPGSPDRFDPRSARRSR